MTGFLRDKPDGEEPAIEVRPASLAGLDVVSTRPVGPGATDLIERLRELGARAISLPTLEIVFAPYDERHRLREETVKDADLVVFVSGNAVTGFFEGARPDIGGGPLDHWPLWVAIGPGTARRLQAYGILPDSSGGHASSGEPAETRSKAGGYTSEGLLGRPELGGDRVRGRRITIVRGAGGRPTLARELASRGAEVRYAEVYRRVQARPSREEIESVVSCPSPVVVVTSQTGFESYWEIMKQSAPEAWLCRSRYLTLSERIARFVESRGTGMQTLVAPRADNDAIIETLVGCAGGR